MTDLFKNKYRIPSARLSSWDYRSGVYFITICTKNKQHFFGTINSDNQPELSPIGKIAYQCWIEISNHFPYVALGPFVIMPNHMHGIIIIRDIDEATQKRNSISPQKGSLATIIRSYKGACSKLIRKECPDTGFQWQERFYDRIIWDNGGYENVCKYIWNNPCEWRNGGLNDWEG